MDHASTLEFAGRANRLRHAALHVGVRAGALRKQARELCRETAQRRRSSEAEREPAPEITAPDRWEETVSPESHSDLRPVVMFCCSGLTRLRLQRCLTGFGYRPVSVSPDPAQLLRLAPTLAPDVLLIDLSALGDQAPAQLRSLREAWPAAVVLAIVNSTAQARIAREAGVSAVLEKPFTDDQLHALLGQFINSAP
ncbi:MAG: hypothetical protein ACK47B_02785 [Armatimonadota bacterium]